jgi:hypothetical protein
MKRLQLLLHIGCLFASPKAFEVGTFHPLASSSPVAGIPFSSCLFLPIASGLPRSAEVGGKAAKNSISYMKTEVAMIYYAKADKICRPP